MNPFMKRAAQRGSTGHGNASEKQVGKKLGARQTPASGAMRSAKGDLTYKRRWLGESKATKNDTMKLELGWLNKITVEALNLGKAPFLTVSFVTEDGKPRKSGQWVMLQLEVFKELTDGDSVP